MSDTVQIMLTILHVQGTRRVKIHKASRDAMREAALNPLAMNSRGRFVYMTGVQVTLDPIAHALLGMPHVILVSQLQCRRQLAGRKGFCGNMSLGCAPGDVDQA